VGSRALQGDGTLSAIEAATSVLALAALMLYHTLGWWWADRAAAPVAALSPLPKPGTPRHTTTYLTEGLSFQPLDSGLRQNVDPKFI
jgi:hypothetical protein